VIEAVLAASGSRSGAAEFICRPAIHNELRNIALPAGRRDEAERSLLES